ncbi:MAG: hypothetical protein Q7R86_00640 [bacterium]|nr:hypothetical protein [bacterium]
MHPVLTVLLAGLFSAALFLFLTLYLRQRKILEWHSHTIGVASLTCAVGLWAILVLLFIRTVPSMSSILTPRNEIIANFSEGVILWRSDDLLEGNQIVSWKPDTVLVATLVAPITDNPKVREFHYSVQIVLYGDPNTYLEDKKQGFDWENVSWRLTYLLYEFNEKCSRDLAGFYNPLDSSQQERFLELTRDFLSPQLQVDRQRIEAKFWHHEVPIIRSGSDPRFVQINGEYYALRFCFG